MSDVVRQLAHGQAIFEEWERLLAETEPGDRLTLPVATGEDGAAVMAYLGFVGTDLPGTGHQ